MPRARKQKNDPRPPGPALWKRWWLPAAIVALAAVLRLHNLGGVPAGLCHDEAANAINFTEAIETGRWQVFYPDNNGREGLFINVQGLFVLVAQPLADGREFAVEPWMMRVPSAVFGTLTVLGLYLLVRALTGRVAAGAASALMMASGFWHVNFSRIGFRATMAPFWLVWALYFLHAGFQAVQAGRRQAGVRMILAAGLCYGLGFHSYLAYRATPPLALAILIWWLVMLRRDGKVRDWLTGAGTFLGSAVVAVAPLAFYFLTHPVSWSGRANQLTVFAKADPWRLLGENIWKSVLMFNVHGDEFWRHNISGGPQLFLPVGLLFLVGILMTVKRPLNPAGLLSLLWLVIGILPAALSDEGVPHALRALIAAPAAYLLAGLGADRVWGWITGRYSKHATQALTAAFALLLAGQCWTAYFGTFARAPQLVEAFGGEQAKLGSEVRALPAGPPKYIVIPQAKLDSRGVPEGFDELAVMAQAYSERARQRNNVHFVTTREEAERASREPGASLFLWR